ncbi:hypothetical protein GGS20DRAFT_257771 [Poronia punctata]|nr:hypothetical protein GGS20DRAFT_257771 [Poronia punctata]
MTEKTTTALGTRILSPKASVSNYPPPPSLTLPQATYRRPIINNNINNDNHHHQYQYHVPTPPITTTNNNNNKTGLAPPPRPRPAPPLALSSILKSPRTPSSSQPHDPTGNPSPAATESSPNEEEFIPILHQPIPKLGSTPARTPILVIVPPPPPPPPTHIRDRNNDNDLPTPSLSPSPSRTKGFKLARLSQFFPPRDALGISNNNNTNTIPRKRSQRAFDDYHHDPHHDNDDYGYGYDDDTEPLSPSPMMQAQLAISVKPRKTIMGVLEGWWDLGLLERGKSFKRKMEKEKEKEKGEMMV